MRKLLIIAVAILGMASAQAQEFSLNYGLGIGQEHIGSDIKSGQTFSFNFQGDLFKKSNFNFGPSVSVYHLGELTTKIESIETETFFGGGLFAGFDSKRFSFESGVQVINGEMGNGEDVFFTSVSTSSIKYRFKDSPFGVKLSYDYFLNKNLFHYTSSVNAGIFIKF